MYEEDKLEKLNNKMKYLGIIAGIVLLGLVILLMFASSFYWTSESGYSYDYQNTWTEKEIIIDKPGTHLKFPGFSIITPYKQVFTIDRTGNEKSKASFVGDMMTVSFADTYVARIPGTFRFRLPSNHEEMKRLHHEFRSFENLISSLVEKTALDVAVTTGMQFTGEEFFLGAVNQYKAAINDQLVNGIYKTERKQVEVTETSLAKVGLDQEDSNKLKKTAKLVWKTVPLKDDNENFIRLVNPLAEYGITAAPFTMDRAIPEKQLQSMLADKKRLVADRIRFVQEQETAKEEAKTEQLRKDIERTRATQEALKTKELAVIAAQQQVELAEKEAERETVEQNKLKDLAVIQKTKELEMAESDLGIQKAAYESSKYEAKAIREKGLAEAAVIKAKYSAYDKTIYMAELKAKTDMSMYDNLRSFQIEMPNILNMGGSGNGDLPTNLKTLTDLSLFNTFDTSHKPAK